VDSDQNQHTVLAGNTTRIIDLQRLSDHRRWKLVVNMAATTAKHPFLSEYEIKRAAQIAKNHEMLQTLKIKDAAKSLAVACNG
jgi:hypothetical protein